MLLGRIPQKRGFLLTPDIEHLARNLASFSQQDYGRNQVFHMAKTGPLRAVPKYGDRPLPQCLPDEGWDDHFKSSEPISGMRPNSKWLRPVDSTARV
jgi:hypothetical protein